MQTHYKKFQRELRKNMPLPEVIIWQRIRQRQTGVKFRRQYTMGNRFFDFYSPEIKLGIEIDGESHFIKDQIRNKNIEEDRKLEKEGIKIIRFLNSEVMKNLDAVFLRIVDEIKNKTSPTQPSPF